MNYFKTAFASFICILFALSAVACKNDENSVDIDAFAQFVSTAGSTEQTLTQTTTSTTTAAKTTTTAKSTTTTVQTTAVSTELTLVNTTVSQAPQEVIMTTVPAGANLEFLSSGIVRQNDEYAALMADLNNIMYPYRNTVSFTYENLENGICISYNGDKRYNSCSTIKAPYCKWLLTSGVELDKNFKMTSSSVNGYSGRIDNMPVGTEFSVEYLIYRTIVFSDNTAYNVLFQNCGYQGFNDMTTALGLTTKLGRGLNYRKVSSNEMRTYFKDIYGYCQTEQGAYLRSLLTSCDYDLQIGYALPQYEVAEKYGCQSSTRNLHACAIVYADSPFVLTVMSGLNPDDAQSLAIFRQLAEIIDRINTQQTKPDETTTVTVSTTTTAKVVTTSTQTSASTRASTTKATETTPAVTVPVTTTSEVTTVPTTTAATEETTLEIVEISTTTTAP